MRFHASSFSIQLVDVTSVSSIRVLVLVAGMFVTDSVLDVMVRTGLDKAEVVEDDTDVSGDFIATVLS